MFRTYLTIAAITAIMASAVVYGLIKSGSPFSTREIKLDQQKVTDITNLASAVAQYYSKNKTLPMALSDVTQFLYGTKNTKDPDTNQDYEYIPGQNSNYKLCSTFKTDSNQNNNYGYYNNIYTHTKGHYCFNLDANLYGLVSTPKPQQSASVPVAPVMPVAGSFCSTQGTKMVIAPDGKGTIGCDVYVSKKIDLTKSYCQGQKSLQKADLMPDAYSRPNHYYATLNGLDPAEEVKVFAYNAEEGMVECIPSLNKR